MYVFKFVSTSLILNWFMTIEHPIVVSIYLFHYSYFFINIIIFFVIVVIDNVCFPK